MGKWTERVQSGCAGNQHELESHKKKHRNNECAQRAEQKASDQGIGGFLLHYLFGGAQLGLSVRGPPRRC